MLQLPAVARLAYDAMKAKAGRAPSRAEVTLAVAIAVAESGSVANPKAGVNPDAVNTANRNGTTDTGIWQINSVHNLTNLKDPRTNATAMAQIAWRNGSWNWQPWSAYNAGRHIPALPAAAAAYDEAIGGGKSFLDLLGRLEKATDPNTPDPKAIPGIIGAIDTKTDPNNPGNVVATAANGAGDMLGRLGGILAPFTKLATRLGDPAFWRRVGAFLAGLALVVLGLAWLGRREALNAVTSTVKGVTG